MICLAHKITDRSAPAGSVSKTPNIHLQLSTEFVGKAVDNTPEMAPSH
jgi:hypothetical protein